MEDFLLSRGALLALALLLFGCIGEQGSQPQSLSGAQPGASNFTVPFAQTAYTARYTVNEDGAETEKTVWRMDDMMRIRLGSGEAAVDFFLLANRAYSCSAVSGSPKCFDVTGRTDGAQLGQVFPPDPSSLEKAEAVDIGGLEGQCYQKLVASGIKRKICFAPLGVVAYDEWVFGSGNTHTEYLVELDYSADRGDFALPSSPKDAPSE